MRIFKNKFILSPLIIFLALILISVPCIDAYFGIFSYYNYEKDYNSNIEKTDTLFLGTSNLFYSVIPDEYDKIMNTSSYNCSYPAFGMMLYYYHLCEVLKRDNKLTNVFLELEYGAVFNEQFGTVEPIQSAMHRIIGKKEKISFIFHYVDINNIGNFYGHAMNIGKDYFFRKILRYAYCAYKKITTGNFPPDNVDTSEKYIKGYIGAEKAGYKDKFCPDYSAVTKQSMEEKQPDKKQLEYFHKIEELCKENNIKLTLLISPISDNALLKIDNMDFIKRKYEEISDDKTIKIFDVNLLKDKSNILSDEDDFFDDSHMTDSGAEKYTKLLTDFMNNADMEYYDSYKSVNQNLQKKYNTNPMI